MTMKKKLEKIEYNTPEWDKSVRELAYRCIIIKQCPHCGAARKNTYICPRCDKDPGEKVNHDT